MTASPSYPNRASHCVAYQKDFIRTFLAGEPRLHVLSSLPGLGKSSTALAACAEAWNSRVARRILILAPTRMLLTHWADTLERSAIGSEVLVVDRRRWREIRANPASTVSPQNSVRILVLSKDVLREDDAATLLGSTHWDLVVVDDADAVLGDDRPAEFVHSLLRNTRSTRTLLLANSIEHLTGITALVQFLPQAVITNWTAETPRRFDGRPALEDLHIQWMPYRRTPDEQAVLLHLQDSLAKLRNAHASIGTTAVSLLQAGSSSLFTLEQRLRRIRARRNELAHGRTSVAEEGLGGDVDDLEEDDSSLAAGLTPYVTVLAELSARLLPEIERIEGDPKLERTVELVSKLLNTNRRKPRICIFTQFVDTAAYVADALSESLPGVARLTGQVPLQRRDAIIATLADSGGVLVSTGTTATYPEFDMILLYDIPLSAARLSALIAHAVRKAADSPPAIHAMLDTSRTLDIEALQKDLLEGKSPGLIGIASDMLGKKQNEDT